MRDRVYKPARKRLSQRKLLAVYDSTDGVCHVCLQKIRGGEPWDADHVKRLADGGEDDIANMKPAHKRCHKKKSAEEATLAAGLDKIAAKHLGIYRPPKRIMPGSRASRFKIRLDRTIIYRGDK